MDSKLIAEVQRVAAEADLRQLTEDIAPFFKRVMPLNNEAMDALSLFFNELAHKHSPEFTFWVAFITGQAWQRGVDEAELES